MEIIKGSLDDISRPASREQTRSRGSSLSSLLSDRVCPPAPFELVVLTTEASNIQNCPGETAAQPSDSGPDGDQSHSVISEDENGAAELQRAFEEMRRLDEILNAKMCKEKEIQRQRRDLQAKLWQDLKNNLEGHSECAQETLNTKLFLALEALTGEKEEEKDFTSVFETQVPYREQAGDDQCWEQKEKRPVSVTESFEVSVEDVGDKQFKSSQCVTSKSKNMPKDFIKRNIESVSCEEGQVFLTYVEKERLAELLREIDEEEDDGARGEDDKEAMRVVSALTAQGYTPEPADLEQLMEIDSKIRLLIPIEEFHSVQSSYTNISMSQGLGSKISWKCIGVQQPGEKVLQDIKERREQETRLQEIQQQLEILGHSQELTDASPGLTEEELTSLLDECQLTESWNQDHEMNEITPNRSDLSI
ncbi:fibrous sheath-interacting protein 1 [Menidia menidia]